MTHDGPQDFGTMNAWTHELEELESPLQPGWYRFGSSELASLLRDKKENIVCNIHGHDHYGAFMDYVRERDRVKVPVINPGSLAWQEYGTLKLAKVDDKWKVVEVCKKFT